jgi:hypothetical protein
MFGIDAQPGSAQAGLSYESRAAYVQYTVLSAMKNQLGV